MPVFEMPLESMKTYPGSSPCPENIDVYWDRAIREMKAIDPEVQLLPAEFTCPYADCYHMYYTGVGGARIYAKLVKPKKRSEAGCPAVVLFHGYSMDSGDWHGMLPYAAAGFVAAAMDCRGQGGRSEDIGGVRGNTLHGHIIRGLEEGPEKLLFRSIYLDAAQLAGLVMAMPEVDENRVGAFGGSQGGGLTLACASLEPRIQRCAPQYPFLCDFKRIGNMDLNVDAYSEIKEWFRRFDPHHMRENEFYNTLSYIDLQNLAKRIKAQTLMITALMDTICPPSTQFAAYNKIGAEKNMLLYHDFGHEYLPGSSDRVFEFMMEL